MDEVYEFNWYDKLPVIADFKSHVRITGIETIEPPKTKLDIAMEAVLKAASKAADAMLGLGSATQRTADAMSSCSTGVMPSASDESMTSEKYLDMMKSITRKYPTTDHIADSIQYGTYRGQKITGAWIDECDDRWLNNGEFIMPKPKAPEPEPEIYDELPDHPLYGIM